MVCKRHAQLKTCFATQIERGHLLSSGNILGITVLQAGCPSMVLKKALRLAHELPWSWLAEMILKKCYTLIFQMWHRDWHVCFPTLGRYSPWNQMCEITLQRRSWQQCRFDPETSWYQLKAVTTQPLNQVQGKFFIEIKKFHPCQEVICSAIR